MLAIDLSEIHSLTDFQRNAKRHISRMKKTRRPLVLTINGKAEMIALDVESFQQVLEALDRIEAIEGIQRGLESMKKGKGKGADEVLEALRKKYKISRQP
jgi:PHD/YefM family antitoxin component YafN of YafNO toxin-antitoxin module